MLPSPLVAGQLTTATQGAQRKTEKISVFSVSPWLNPRPSEVPERLGRTRWCQGKVPLVCLGGSFGLVVCAQSGIIPPTQTTSGQDRVATGHETGPARSGGAPTLLASLHPESTAVARPSCSCRVSKGLSSLTWPFQRSQSSDKFSESRYQL